MAAAKAGAKQKLPSRSALSSPSESENGGFFDNLLTAAKPRRSRDDKYEAGGKAVVHFLGLFCEKFSQRRKGWVIFLGYFVNTVPSPHCPCRRRSKGSLPYYFIKEEGRCEDDQRVQNQSFSEVSE